MPTIASADDAPTRPQLLARRKGSSPPHVPTPPRDAPPPSAWTNHSLQLVDRRVLHKLAASEVLILDCIREDADSWLLPFELPRRDRPHSSASPTRVSFLQALELVRQTGIAAAHLGEGVPREWRFLMQQIALGWASTPPNFPAHGPYRGVIRVRATERRCRGGQLSGLDAEVFLYCSDQLVASGTGIIDFVSQSSYRALRRGSPGFQPASDPEVLLEQKLTRSDTVLHARLGVNTDDPFVFDHPVDHLPGMLLAQAALTAHARVSKAARPSRFELRSKQFAEHGIPTFVHCIKSGESATHSRFYQSGLLVAEVDCG